MLCPELFSKNLLVLGLSKIVIIKIVVEAKGPVSAETFCACGVVHFCFEPVNVSCPRKYKRFGFRLQFRRGSFSNFDVFLLVKYFLLKLLSRMSLFVSSSNTVYRV